MPQSLIGLKQIKSGEIGSYITGALGFGVTGVDSISIYKDLFVTGKSTFSGEVSFNNDVTFKEEAFFNSGAKFSGDITGYKNLIVSGNSLISGVATFKTGVFFQKDVTTSGTFTSQGAAVFNDPVTINDSSTFNSSVVLNNTLSVGVSTSTFSGKVNLLGNNILGSNAGGGTTNYFIGSNIFTGNSSFTGDIYSAGVNNFSGANNFNSTVNFRSGVVTFSGTKQDFLTDTNLSGYTKILRTGEVENLIITNKLSIDNTSFFDISGSGIFQNTINLSGINTFNFLAGANESFYASTYSEFNSGAYLILNDNSHLSLKTGAYFDISGKIYNRNGSTAFYNSGSKVYFQTGSSVSGILNLLSGSSIGIGTSLPSGQMEVRGTGYFTDLRISGYEVITKSRFNAKSYSLNSGDTYKTITYNSTSGNPIINPNIRATGTGAEIADSDLLVAIISGVPSSTSSTIMFSAPIPSNDRYLLDVIISSPTF